MAQVTVLMSTYNGERYLQEQIKSLQMQEDVDIQILVRDDGSADKTLQILDEYQQKGVLKWYAGQNLKSARSFLDLVNNAPETEYYAFCDQDDVWFNDKLKRAIEALEGEGSVNNIPLLYCSNYQLVDAVLNDLPDNGHASTTTYGAALASSCCTGCTVVFNQALRNYIVGREPRNVVMHDDWIHKLCLAVGGTVIYDDNKTLMYRQHSSNVDGGVHTFGSKIKGLIKRIKTKDCLRSKQIEDLFTLYGDQMPYDNKCLTQYFIQSYHKGFFSRIKLLASRRIRTPYKRLNRGFYAAILFHYF